MARLGNFGRGAALLLLVAALGVTFSASSASGARPVNDVTIGTGTVHPPYAVAVQDGTGDAYVFEDWQVGDFDHFVHVWAPGAATPTSLTLPQFPSDTYDSIELDFIGEATTMSGAAVPAGDLLVLDGTDNLLYALDPATGTVHATMGVPPSTQGSSGEVEGAAYDVVRHSIWVVHEHDDEIDELDLDPTATGTAGILNSFQTVPAGAPAFDVFAGDVDVDPASGNLWLVGQGYSFARELAPTGALVRDVVIGLHNWSGLALDDDDPGQAWITTWEACGTCPPSPPNLFHFTGIGVTASLGDTVVSEGNSGVTSARLTVTLSEPSLNDVVVHYSTADGTATAPGDYTAKIDRTLVIPAGATARPINVDVVGETVNENKERFSVDITSVEGALLLDGHGVVEVLDDDPSSGANKIRIGAAVVSEGDIGGSGVQVTLTLSNPAPVGGEWVTVRTKQLTAKAGSDYVHVETTIVIPEGETSGLFSIPIRGGTTHESRERFGVGIVSAPGYGLARRAGLVFIMDDD
ncbi:MAG TPA: Calx-beta domain-containing protein [Gaiellaceae bacterium]|nr:Calx-beta domain-containing protein [Gaiellaceae bacterium]